MAAKKENVNSRTCEANFDGLVGPTHCYAGLSYGNIASMIHRAQISNPREAALQGLEKAKALNDLGMVQGILPPQERPDIATLRRLGFTGTDSQVIQSAAKTSPELLAVCSSASSMWTANAATISPSCDSGDSKVHLTAANLNQKLHRAIESDTTTAILQAMFPDSKYFNHHPALPHSDTLGDEGAANHTRLCLDFGKPGLQFFVFGRRALDSSEQAITPRRFPARQTLEASQAIARLHQLPPEQVYFAQQNPETIDGGAFHNDVVAVGNQDVLFHHEYSFYKSNQVIADLKRQFEKISKSDLKVVEVPNAKIPMPDAIKSYLFNSQLVTLPSGKMALIAPQECQEIESVRGYLADQIGQMGSPIHEIHHFNLRQSMENGGGPACLRLRVVLTPAERQAVNPRVWINEQSYPVLSQWVKKHYRDRLKAEDLGDPHLLQESRTALDELTGILGLGSIYPFQK